MRVLICSLLFLLPAAGVANEEIYPGYTWQALGAGIYLHSQNEPLAGPVDGNSVIIVNDDGVLVVDTHINPAVARAVIGKIRSMTDVPVTYVVNTHWHDDHTNGNHAYRQAFPDVTIIAHRDALSIEFANRNVELKWLGRGNTDGDVVVWLPDDKVLITGDLLVAPIPFAFDSPMVEWSATLRRLGEIDARLIIPGHGAPQYDDGYLVSVQQLIDATTSRVQSARENGAGFEDLAGAVNLEDYRRQFTGEDPERRWAWQSYFFGPGLKSAWTSLGYPLPAE